MSEFGDFNSADPWERYNAHQRAKGRSPMQDPDEARDRAREAHSASEKALDDGAGGEEDDSEAGMVWKKDSWGPGHSRYPREEGSC